VQVQCLITSECEIHAGFNRHQALSGRKRIRRAHGRPQDVFWNISGAVPPAHACRRPC